MDGGHGTARVKGDGDVVGGDGVREFGQCQDVVRIVGEEGAEEFATEGFDRSADRVKGIDGLG
jgi:hypothetical protein